MPSEPAPFFSLPALLQYPDGPIGGSIVKISHLGPEGAFVALDRPIDMGAKTELVFHLPAFNMDIKMKAKVIFRRMGKTPGIGLWFDEPTYVQQVAIREAIFESFRGPVETDEERFLELIQSHRAKLSAAG